MKRSSDWSFVVFDEEQYPFRTAEAGAKVWTIELHRPSPLLTTLVIRDQTTHRALHVEDRQRFSSDTIITRLQRLVNSYGRPDWLLGICDELQTMPSVSRWATSRGIGVGFLPPVPSLRDIRGIERRQSIWVDLVDARAVATTDECARPLSHTLDHPLSAEMIGPELACSKPLRVEDLVIKDVMILSSGDCNAVGMVGGAQSAGSYWRLKFSVEVFAKLLSVGRPPYDPYVRKVINGGKPGPRLLGSVLRVAAVRAIEIIGTGDRTLRITGVEARPGE